MNKFRLPALSDQMTMGAGHPTAFVPLLSSNQEKMNDKLNIEHRLTKNDFRS